MAVDLRRVLCSLKEVFRKSEEGVPVLGVIKCGVMCDIAQ